MVEDGRQRDLVGVKDQDELAVRRQEGVVQVPGLGMAGPAGPIGRPRDPADAVAACLFLQFGTVAVVEDPGLVRVGDLAAALAVCITRSMGSL